MESLQAESRHHRATQSTEILVISLPGAEPRRRLMRAQLDVPGMPPYRFIDGIDGRTLLGDELAGVYDEAAALRHAGRQLTRPEIGCASSHLAAYRDLTARRLGVALVLEDDALLGHQFPAVLERLVPMLDPARAQAIMLSHVVRYSAWGRRRVDRTHRLCRPYEAYGAHAYLITLAGAQAMLAALPRVRTVADDWRYFMKAGILDVSAVVPYLVGTSPFSVSSQIGPERFSQPRSGSMRRVMRKYLWQKFLFQLLAKPALRLHKQEQSW